MRRAGLGGQDVEHRGFNELYRAGGLAGAALFHRKPIEESRLGRALSDDVAAALDDTGGRPLVACVLNTVDDALDRADPGGTTWIADAVRHLVPLLDRARLTGRVVVLTADHGHVVERRQGRQQPFPTLSSTRSRAADQPAGPGEVEVTGRRVLAHGGTAVLAVDERLRYGPVKAGYHGGGSPAEAVVPVCVLVPGAVPEAVDGQGPVPLRLAPPQEPGWWLGPLPAAGVPVPITPETDRAPTLFDDTVVPGPVAVPRGLSGATAVVASRTYAAQRRTAQRVPVSDDQVTALLAALLAAPDTRLAPTSAAAALGVAPVQLRGAVTLVARLLNVEGYPVLRFDADGATVVLDAALLAEQFEVPA